MAPSKVLWTLGGSHQSERSVARDHGVVVLFVPFTGTWHQIIGVFASRSNMKSETLGKIILEAVVMSENAGLHVDFITTDGAAWNRSMWHSFSIHGRKENTVCRRQHPTDPDHFLHFISDFPHLLKCVRSTFVRTGVKLFPYRRNTFRNGDNSSAHQRVKDVHPREKYLASHTSFWRSV